MGASIICIKPEDIAHSNYFAKKNIVAHQKNVNFLLWEILLPDVNARIMYHAYNRTRQHQYIFCYKDCKEISLVLYAVRCKL